MPSDICEVGGIGANSVAGLTLNNAVEHDRESAELNKSEAKRINRRPMTTNLAQGREFGISNFGFRIWSSAADLTLMDPDIEKTDLGRKCEKKVLEPKPSQFLFFDLRVSAAD